MSRSPATDRLSAGSPEHRLFKEFIEAAMREVTGRYADYFSHCTVAMPHIGRVANEYNLVPSLQQFSQVECEVALVRGAQILEDLGVVVELDSPAANAVSMLLMQSILDAYAVAYGSLVMPRHFIQERADPAPHRYSIKETNSGVRYARSIGDGRPLIVISTTGAPLRVWSTLINDTELGRPCIMVQSGAGPLLEGGTPNSSSLIQEVADIRDVLAEEDVDQADVMAWCNGSLTAIALAREAPDRIAALFLVSPTFHGVMDASKYPSPFEDSLVNAFNIAKADREAGRRLIQSLSEVGTPEVGNLPIEKRADAVLRSPPVDYVRDLVIPLSTIEYFENYIERVLNDECYDVCAALGEVRCPIWFAVGTHDAAVNTQLAHDMLSTYAHDVVQITVHGSGHHIHLLQYSYLRYLLHHLASASAPMATARVNVEFFKNP